ncbi:MAG: mandelate racemase/muconate lactonizing enzyme family protein, partial [candidate division NC10 bacterium]
MKITRVRPHLLSLPLPRPVKTSAHDIRTVDTVFVEMETDGGAVGSGYCFAFGPKRAQALNVLVEDLLPLYEGQDPTAPRALFDRAWRAINF